MKKIPWPITMLIAVALLVVWPLFDYSTVLTGDIWGLATWTDVFRERFSQSLATTWEHRWAGGVPFVGLVPFGLYLVLWPFAAIAGDAIFGVQIAAALFYSLAGVTMFYFLRRHFKDLPSFLGALVYLLLPVHTGSLLTMGLVDLLIVYSVAPLILLATDAFFESPKPWRLFSLLSLLAGFALVQIESTFIFTLFMFAPYIIVRYLCYRRTNPTSLLSQVLAKPLPALAGALLLAVSAGFYATAVTQSGSFSFHPEFLIEEGRTAYSFLSPSHIFLKAESHLDLFANARTEYYIGAVVFALVLLAAFIATANIRRSGTKRWFTGFFLVAGLFWLWACFTSLPGNEVFYSLPFLEQIRVPVRFYYLFAIAVAVGIAFVAESLASWSERTGGRFWATTLLLVATSAMVLDFAPYHTFYKETAVTRSVATGLCPAITQAIERDVPSGQTVARVYVYPNLSFPFRCARSNGAPLVETVNNWLEWDQVAAQTEAISPLNEKARLKLSTTELLATLKPLSVDYLVIQKSGVIPHWYGDDHIKEYQSDARRLVNDDRLRLVEEAEIPGGELKVFGLRDVEPRWLLVAEDGQEIPLSPSAKLHGRGFSVEVEPPTAGTLVTPYADAPWWQLRADEEIIPHEAGDEFRLSFPVKAGRQTIEATFKYPIGRNIGGAVVLLAVLSLVLYLIFILRKRTASSA